MREELIRVNMPRVRPPLVVCEHPREVGPGDSIILNDLRATLLEIAGEPPRLRQDQSLFAKEIDRFEAVLDPLATWLIEAMQWSPKARLARALEWAGSLQLVKGKTEGKEHRLHLSPKGEKWLTSGVEEQRKAIHEQLIDASVRHDPFGVYADTTDPYSNSPYADTKFLGSPVIAQKLVPGKARPSYWNAKTEDYMNLRRSIDKALSALPLGIFHRLDNVLSHVAFAQHNPLNLGVAVDQVQVFQGSRSTPPLEEQREQLGKTVVEVFIRRRLIAHGCFQAAIDNQGQLCVARGPLYDAYFGRKVAQSDLTAQSDVAAKVVIQPDFSVIIIGLNPAPAAELAPFCIRAAQGGSHGAFVLKITRDSVVKAVTHGLKPAEIMARLKRHATHEIPANVLREVEGWANWVRRVTPSTLTALRCPDREAADRVMTALKSQAERVTDTLVAIDQKKLTSIERNKLKAQGIIVDESSKE